MVVEELVAVVLLTVAVVLDTLVVVMLTVVVVGDTVEVVLVFVVVVLVSVPVVVDVVSEPSRVQCTKPSKDFAGLASALRLVLHNSQNPLSLRQL